MTRAPTGLLAAPAWRGQHDGRDRGGHDVHPVSARNHGQVIFRLPFRLLGRLMITS
jgi:hypothetical protein